MATPDEEVRAIQDQIDRERYSVDSTIDAYLEDPGTFCSTDIVDSLMEAEPETWSDRRTAFLRTQQVIRARRDLGEIVIDRKEPVHATGFVRNYYRAADRSNVVELDEGRRG